MYVYVTLVMFQLVRQLATYIYIYICNFSDVSSCQAISNLYIYICICNLSDVSSCQAISNLYNIYTCNLRDVCFISACQEMAF